MLVSLYDVISCDVINVKNFLENLKYFFYILATPLKQVIDFYGWTYKERRISGLKKDRYKKIW